MKKTKTLPQMIKEYIGWKKLGASDNTILVYENYLSKFSRHCFTTKQNPLDHSTLHSFLVSCKRSNKGVPVKGNTLNAVLTCLKSFFKYFLESGQITRNPASMIPRFKEEAATIIGFKPDEAKELLNSSYDSPYSDYWTPMILLGWHYGMRLGDTACFQRPWVNNKTKQIKFIPAKRKKKEIILPLVPDVDLALSKVPHEDDTYYFPLARDRYYFRGTLSNQFKKIVKDAGLDHSLTFHCLRHGAATRMLKQGVRTTTITEIIGWESPAMLQRYIDRDEEDISKALEGSITV
jgi:site-specific recombinase XerD